MKNALDHIKAKGTGSRTIIFNAIMTSITAFLMAVSVVVQESYPLVEALLAPTLVLVSSIGNIILYGMTKVKNDA